MNNKQTGGDMRSETIYELRYTIYYIAFFIKGLFSDSGLYILLPETKSLTIFIQKADDNALDGVESGEIRK